METGRERFSFRVNSDVKDLLLGPGEKALYIREEEDNVLTSVRLKPEGEESADSTPQIDLFEEFVDIGGVKLERRRQ
jgi:hypothetical protein